MKYLLSASETVNHTTPDDVVASVIVILALIAMIGVSTWAVYLLNNPLGLLDNKRTGDWCTSATGYCPCKRRHGQSHEINKRNLEYIREREAGSIDDKWCKSVTGHCRCKKMHFEEHEKNRIRIEYHLEPDAEIRTY